MGGLTSSAEDIATLRPEEIRQLPERHALVVAENGRPILARLDRCIEGPQGWRLLAEQATLRDRLEEHPRPGSSTPGLGGSPPWSRPAAAGLVPDTGHAVTSAPTCEPSLIMQI